MASSSKEISNLVRRTSRYPIIYWKSRSVHQDLSLLGPGLHLEETSLIKMTRLVEYKMYVRVRKLEVKSAKLSHVLKKLYTQTTPTCESIHITYKPQNNSHALPYILVWTCQLLHKFLRFHFLLNSIQTIS